MNNELAFIFSISIADIWLSRNKIYVIPVLTDLWESNLTDLRELDVIVNKILDKKRGLSDDFN